MKNKIMYFAMFIGGVTVGSIASMQYFKKKYELIAEEEIKSVKETLSGKTEVRVEESVEPEEDIEELTEEEKEEYKNIITDYTSMSKKEKEDDEMKKKKPYIIPPEEFGEKDEYDLISLTYHSDHVLVNNLDEVIKGKELESLIGKDSLSHFGEYEDDSVFVRNEKLKTDIEILKDLDPFFSDDYE